MAKRTGKSKLMRRRMKYLEDIITRLQQERKICQTNPTSKSSQRQSES